MRILVEYGPMVHVVSFYEYDFANAVAAASNRDLFDLPGLESFGFLRRKKAP